MKAAFNNWWLKLAPRERQALGLAAAVLGLAVLWWLAVAPAWTTLRQAPAQHARLDAELQALQTMAAKAKSLQAQPPIGRDDALRALEAATMRHLGEQAKLSVLGDQATASFSSAQAADIAQWLADVRINARSVPTELRLSPAAATPEQSAATLVPASSGVWQGSVVFALSR